MEKRYLVVANNGRMSVTVNEDLKLTPNDVVVYRAYTIDEAFDWKEDMQARLDRRYGPHCATCE